MTAPPGDIFGNSCGASSSYGGPRHCNSKVFISPQHKVFIVPDRNVLRRKYEGRILLHGSYVFLDVVWLAVILKPILIHKETFLHDGSISLQVDDNHSIVLSEQAHKESWDNLKTQGILETELAGILWPDGLCNYVLPTLQSIDLAFPLSGDGKKLVVMMRLPEERPQSVAEDLRHFRHGSHKAIGGTWKMFLGAPPGAIEKVLTRCCRLGATQIFWRFGVMIKGSFGEVVGGRFALLLEYIENQLLIEVHGNPKSVGPWMALSYAMSAMLSMVQDSPGLLWEASIGCPEHTNESLKVSEEARHPGQRLIWKGCYRCSRETKELGAFAEDVLAMVDVEKTRVDCFAHMITPLNTCVVDEVFHDVKARFTSLCDHYGIPYPKEAHVEPEQLENVMKTMYDVIHEKEKESVVTELARGMRDLIQEELREMWIGPDGPSEEREELVNNVKFIVDMMMAERGERFDAPRLCCVLPPWDFGQSEGISPGDQEADRWISRLENWRNDNYRGGKRIFTKQMRLFLVCAQTYRLVPCGVKGQGYEIREIRERWQKVGHFLTTMLHISCATVDTAVAAKVLTNTIGEASKLVLGLAEEVARAQLENLKHPTINTRSATGGWNEHSTSSPVAELGEKDYAELRKYLYDVENSVRIRKLRTENSRTDSEDAEFVFFEDVMEKVQERGGSATVQWVLRGYADDWHQRMRARRRS